MRRVVYINILLIACLGAATALAVAGFRWSRQVAAQDRQLLSDTLLELAKEKVFGIETQIISADRPLFDAIGSDPATDLAGLAGQASVASVLVVDEQGRVLPGGYLGRPGPGGPVFGRLFQELIWPYLPLAPLADGERGTWHGKVGDGEYLLSFVTKTVGGQRVTVVLEEDIAQLVGAILPEFFSWQSPQSPRWFQVINDEGELVYGYPFRNDVDAAVVEIPFAQTATRWRLRVAQRDNRAGHARRQRALADAAVILISLTTLLVGLAVFAWAIARERRASAAKSDFVSAISHELKTPLSIISLFSEMLADQRVTSPSQVQEYASKIRRESTLLSQLIDNVLDFAKMDHGKVVFDQEPVDLRDITARAAELIEQRLDGTALRLCVAMPETPVVVFGDENALALAIINLLDNAIKYGAKEGTIELLVAAFDAHVDVRVRDHGDGVPLGEQTKIFERFYRAANARQRKARGSGIGLALVRHIVEAHGGTVGYQAAETKGSVFWMQFPRVRDKEAT